MKASYHCLEGQHSLAFPDVKPLFPQLHHETNKKLVDELGGRSPVQCKLLILYKRHLLIFVRQPPPLNPSSSNSAPSFFRETPLLHAQSMPFAEVDAINPEPGLANQSPDSSNHSDWFRSEHVTQARPIRGLSGIFCWALGKKASSFSWSG